MSGNFMKRYEQMKAEQDKKEEVVPEQKQIETKKKQNIIAYTNRLRKIINSCGYLLDEISYYNSGFRQEIKKLIENGADINALSYSGHTTLSKAVRYNDIKLAKFLIENGADIDLQKNEAWYTPLREAVINGNFDMVKLLVENGANLFLIDSCGFTVFDEEKIKKNKDIEGYLKLQQDKYQNNEEMFYL